MLLVELRGCTIIIVSVCVGVCGWVCVCVCGCTIIIVSGCVWVYLFLFQDNISIDQ